MSAKKRQKAFDCVEMKRRAQERIYAETHGLGPDAEIAYYRKRSEGFWSAIGTGAKRGARTKGRTKRPARSAKKRGRR